MVAARSPTASPSPTSGCPGSSSRGGSAILDEDWLPDSDVLTPTMKLKRRGVLARYGEQIEAMYAGGGIEIATALASPAALAGYGLQLASRDSAGA